MKWIILLAFLAGIAAIAKAFSMDGATSATDDSMAREVMFFIAGGGLVIGSIIAFMVYLFVHL